MDAGPHHGILRQFFYFWYCPARLSQTGPYVHHIHVYAYGFRVGSQHQRRFDYTSGGEELTMLNYMRHHASSSSSNDHITLREYIERLIAEADAR